jgi:hypothetical protein
MEKGVKAKGISRMELAIPLVALALFAGIVMLGQSLREVIH